MSNKKDLTKNLNKVCEDIMDNYDKYTPEEKNKIKQFYQSAINLNDSLEYHDKKKKSFVDFLKASFRNFFG